MSTVVTPSAVPAVDQTLDNGELLLRRSHISEINQPDIDRAVVKWFYNLAVAADLGNFPVIENPAYIAREAVGYIKSAAGPGGASMLRGKKVEFLSCKMIVSDGADDSMVFEVSVKTQSGAVWSFYGNRYEFCQSLGLCSQGKRN